MPVLNLSKRPANKNDRTHGVLLQIANDPVNNQK
jgi:hypothetical protein